MPSYKVTEGCRVAVEGRIAVGGETVTLTEDQARRLVEAGTLEPVKRETKASEKASEAKRRSGWTRDNDEGEG